MGDKRARRVALGDLLTLVFENREGAAAALEEVVRAEHVTDRERIDEEAEALSSLLPPAGELGACLYLDVTDPAELRERLQQLRAIAASLTLRVDDSPAQTHVDRADADEEWPAVQLIGFRLTEQQRERWRAGASVTISVDHAGYRQTTKLNDEQREALAADLRA